MRQPLIMILLLFSIISCRRPVREEKYLFKPTPESFDKYFTKTFNENFFNQNYYSYSERSKVDSLEKFSGAFIDATTGQTHLDTTKYFYTAKAFAIEQKDTTFLRTCKVTLADTTLNFILNDDPFSQRNTELEIVKSGDSFKSNFIVTAVPTDSSYKLPIFTVLTQNVLLDKQKYEKGNNLKGKISLTIKAFYPMSNITDTIKIFGLLKATVD
jgi:hypothetical protein